MKTPLEDMAPQFLIPFDTNVGENNVFAIWDVSDGWIAFEDKDKRPGVAFSVAEAKIASMLLERFIYASNLARNKGEGS